MLEPPLCARNHQLEKGNLGDLSVLGRENLCSGAEMPSNSLTQVAAYSRMRAVDVRKSFLFLT